MTPPAFRFGVSMWPRVTSRGAVVELARRAEDAGFDVFHVADHLGFVSPFEPLVTVAENTGLRVGTFVLNNDFHNPHLLARQAATVDLLSGGRLELGLGAGHMKGEYDEAGIPFHGARVRQARLAASLAMLDRLLRDESNVPAPLQLPRPPFLVGGWSHPTLALAARSAEIVGLAGLRQRPGAEFGTFDMATAEEVDERVAFVREQAGQRAGGLEWNALVQRVVVTDDPTSAAEALLAEGLPMRTPAEALATPFLLVGRAEELADVLLERRARWGISYYVVFGRDLDALAPVVARLKG